MSKIRRHDECSHHFIKLDTCDHHYGLGDCRGGNAIHEKDAAPAEVFKFFPQIFTQ
ncbi:MAG: hypothetical protein ACO3MG_00015 [Saprospiraceae bacterium]